MALADFLFFFHFFFNIFCFGEMAEWTKTPDCQSFVRVLFIEGSNLILLYGLLIFLVRRLRC